MRGMHWQGPPTVGAGGQPKVKQKTQGSEAWRGPRHVWMGCPWLLSLFGNMDLRCIFLPWHWRHVDGTPNGLQAHLAHWECPGWQGAVELLHGCNLVCAPLEPPLKVTKSCKRLQGRPKYQKTKKRKLRRSEMPKVQKVRKVRSAETPKYKKYEKYEAQK